MSGLSKQPLKPFGFTLIEILIAIFIFAIVVTTIFGSYRSVFGDVETLGKGTALYEMARNCLERMFDLSYPTYQHRQLLQTQPSRQLANQ